MAKDALAPTYRLQNESLDVEVSTRTFRVTVRDKVNGQNEREMEVGRADRR